MTTFLAPPLDPMRIVFDSRRPASRRPDPVLTRRMSSLEGLFEREDLRRELAAGSRPGRLHGGLLPRARTAAELPQSVTTILPGNLGGEFYMTKGHQHPDPQGEIYLCLRGTGGLLTFDGTRTSWIEMTPGVIGYMPPGWAHRSVNTGSEEYQFLAVYPGSAGHDYGWVVENGMGERIFAGPTGRCGARSASMTPGTHATAQSADPAAPTTPAPQRVLVTSRSFSTGTRNWSTNWRATASPCCPRTRRSQPRRSRRCWPTADGWIAGTGPITDAHLALAPQLRIVARYGVGVDAVDLAAAGRRGIVVTNTPGANSGAVADHTDRPAAVRPARGGGRRPPGPRRPLDGRSGPGSSAD